MEDILYYSALYDLYGELLTEKQRNYFEDYYFSNLTLSEMSENYGISRNAVHKQLKEADMKLETYEKHLKLFERKEKLKVLVEKIEDTKLKEEIKELLM